MRTFLAILFSASLILSCASNNLNSGFKIIDSHGQVYGSSDIAGQLKNEYNLEKAPKVVVLLTHKANNDKFKEQLSVLEKVDAENYQYIYATGSATGRNKSGYSLKKETAQAMLSGDTFQIRIYDERGSLIESSTTVLNRQEIIRHLTKH